MAAPDREKLAMQVNAEILSSVRDLARPEGRPIQALIDKRKQSNPRPDVTAAYQTSHERFALLYKKPAE